MDEGLLVFLCSGRDFHPMFQNLASVHIENQTIVTGRADEGMESWEASPEISGRLLKVVNICVDGEWPSLLSSI
ncbi:MAG: hypothetical protein Ct9H90mP24_6360 [Methanobacteriota archaeon]|nr:MAG: hypothetical protein Ct9H90mP24_6360 [Euryarchaeota archaeon]